MVQLEKNQSRASPLTEEDHPLDQTPTSNNTEIRIQGAGDSKIYHEDEEQPYDFYQQYPNYN